MRLVGVDEMPALVSLLHLRHLFEGDSALHFKWATDVRFFASLVLQAERIAVPLFSFLSVMGDVVQLIGCCPVEISLTSRSSFQAPQLFLHLPHLGFVFLFSVRGPLLLLHLYLLHASHIVNQSEDFFLDAVETILHDGYFIGELLHCSFQIEIQAKECSHGLSLFGTTLFALSPVDQLLYRAGRNIILEFKHSIVEPPGLNVTGLVTKNVKHAFCSQVH